MVGIVVELSVVGDCEEDMLVASDRGVRANRNRRRVVLRKTAIFRGKELATGESGRVKCRGSETLRASMWECDDGMEKHNSEREREGEDEECVVFCALYL